MALKKTLMIAGAVTSIGLAGSTAAANLASAETGATGEPFGMSGLVDKIADKFNLNENEVKAVFDEHRDEMQAKHQARMEKRLDEAVVEGEITEEQKAAILAKRDELKSEREAHRDQPKDMTHEERREAMKQRHEDLEAWAEENNIPEDFFRFFGGGHGGRHHRILDRGSDTSES